MSTSFAPLVVFAFNRPLHLQRTLDALAACPQAQDTRLHIYCDGARHEREQAAVAKVREVAAAARGFASVAVTYRDRNLGLATSVIEGITAEVTRDDKVIVVEDDLVVSRQFLRYMNDALSLYADDEQVASIHGYCYPVDTALPETFFLRGADCWGWATWRRAWENLRTDGVGLLNELETRGLIQEFDLDGSYPFSRMLRDQIAGRNNSWAIRWHASVYLRGMLTLYPGRSLVDNIGHDASGTHSGHTDVFAQQLAQESILVERQPLIVSHPARQAFARFLRRRHGGPLRRLARSAYRLLRGTA